MAKSDPECKQDFEEKVFSFVSKILRKRFYSLSETEGVSAKLTHQEKPGLCSDTKRSTPNLLDPKPSCLSKAVCFLCGKIDSFLHQPST